MRTQEQLMAEMNALESNPLTDVDAWFDQLMPEEREIILGQVSGPDRGVVSQSRYTEPHDALKREAAARARRPVRAFEAAAGTADVAGSDGSFGAAFDAEDGSVGVLDVDDTAEVPGAPEMTAAEAEHHVRGFGSWDDGDWAQRRRFALLAAQRARAAFHDARDTIDVWGVKRSLKMALKAGLREGARRLFVWSERF